MYEKGSCVPQDSSLAVAWHQKAVDQGLAPAEVELGVMLARGEGLPQDLDRAVHLLRRAAERGEASAQHNLGAVYFSGLKD